MVSKSHRLTRYEFRARGYRTIATPFFSLKMKNNSLPVNRIGVVVAKAVDKRATRRNFLKRQAKAEILRTPDGGKDIVLTIFPRANALHGLDFREEIKKIFKKFRN